jgi:hypothetical protein
MSSDDDFSAELEGRMFGRRGVVVEGRVCVRCTASAQHGVLSRATDLKIIFAKERGESNGTQMRATSGVK